MTLLSVSVKLHSHRIGEPSHSRDTYRDKISHASQPTMYQAFDTEAKFLSYTKTQPNASQRADMNNYSQPERRVGDGKKLF